MTLSFFKVPVKDFLSKAVKTSSSSNEVLVFKQFGDIHPIPNYPAFNGHEKVWFTNCDKNFIYYWLDQRRFPDVKEINLFSHPCSYHIHNRFPLNVQWNVFYGYKKYFCDFDGNHPQNVKFMDLNYRDDTLPDKSFYEHYD
jgi:hypothetical protein